MSEILLLQADLSDLPIALQWVQKVMATIDIDSAQKKKVELALEEVIVNVISHSKDVKQIELMLRDGSNLNEIVFDIVDDGVPFNPLNHPTDENRRDLPLEERSIGGLGIILMKQCMDSLSYQRKDGRNILTLGKKLHFS